MQEVTQVRTGENISDLTTLEDAVPLNHLIPEEGEDSDFDIPSCFFFSFDPASA